MPPTQHLVIYGSVHTALIWTNVLPTARRIAEWKKKKKKLKSVSKTKDCVFGGNERWVTEGKTQIAAQFMDKPHMQTGLLVFHLQPVAVGYRWRSHSCTIFRWHHNI